MFDRARLLRSLGVGAAALGLPAAARASRASGFLEPHPRWRFVFVNHAITNPFFVPTRYGIQDACRHYGVTYEWRGSRRSDVGEMVKAMRRAIDGRAHGIAVSVIDRRAFNNPTAEALRRGIPVVSYNADGGVGNRRLAYIGQDLYQSGLKFGARIVELVQAGDVFLFIATPGQLNIQPRLDGALDAIKDSGTPIRATVLAGSMVLVTTLFLPFEQLLIITNTATLAIFVLVDLALWRIKRCQVGPVAGFAVPRWIPPLAAALSIGLMAAEWLS